MTARHRVTNVRPTEVRVSHVFFNPYGGRDCVAGPLMSQCRYRREQHPPECNVLIGADDEGQEYRCDEPVGLFPHHGKCHQHHGSEVDCDTVRAMRDADETLLRYAL